MRLFILRCIFVVLAFSTTLAQATEGFLDGIPPSVEIAEGFDFIPLTNTVREVRDYFNDNGGTVSDFALVGPTTMAAPPGVDGHLFVATQRGQVFHVTFDRDENDHPVFTGMEPMLDIRDKVSAAIDRGLIGMAVHPNFRNGTGRLYLSYTHANGDLDGYYETTCFDELLGAHTCTEVKKKTAGLAWYQIDDFVGDPDSENLILGTVRGTPEAPSCSDYGPNANCIYSDSGSHTIGSVAFDPETGAVCVATGDGAGFYKAEPDAVRAARLDNLSGKILCVNRNNGRGLRSNPYWTGNPNDFASRTMVYGLRNPYRFMFTEERDLVIYMVGWNQVESAYVVSPDTGGYVGWPCHGVETGVTDYQFLDECQFDAPEPVTPAQYQYNHPPENDYQAAIVGAARFGAAYPDWLQGLFIAGDYRNDWVRILGANEDTGLWEDMIDLAHGTDPDYPIELGAPVMFYNDTAGRVYMMSFLSGVVDGFTVGTIYEIVYTPAADTPEPIAEEDPDRGALTVASFTYEPLEGNRAFSFDCAESLLRGQLISNFPGIQCRWDFGDGSAVVDSRDAISHEFAEFKNYAVTLSMVNRNERVLSEETRRVRVRDPLTQADPFITATHLPERPVSISELFDISIDVLNNGARRPFCALLGVDDDATGETVREISRCANLARNAETTLSFPLFFTDPGDFTLENTFYATANVLPNAEPFAFLGNQVIGSIGIQNRSGTTEHLQQATEESVPEFTGPEESVIPVNDDPVSEELASSESGSSGGSVSVLLLFILSIARLSVIQRSCRRLIKPSCRCYRIGSVAS